MYSELLKAIISLFKSGNKIKAIIAFILLAVLFALLTFSCTNSLYVLKGTNHTITTETTFSADSANVSTDVKLQKPIE